jgi:hypothetical protein
MDVYFEGTLETRRIARWSSPATVQQGRHRVLVVAVPGIRIRPVGGIDTDISFHEGQAGRTQVVGKSRFRSTTPRSTSERTRHIHYERTTAPFSSRLPRAVATRLESETQSRPFGTVSARYEGRANLIRKERELGTNYAGVTTSAGLKDE